MYASMRKVVFSCVICATIGSSAARFFFMEFPEKYIENLKDAPAQPLVVAARPRLPVDRQELVSMFMKPGGEQLLTIVNQANRLSKRQMEQWLLIDPKSAYARFG